LTISELQHALAITADSRDVNDKDVPQFQDLISVCAGLVTVDEVRNVIRMSHYTAQQYFEKTQDRWFPDAKRDITKNCITYLSFNIFGTGFSPTDTAFEERLRSHQFYDYAAHNWGHHARESSAPSQLILDFLKQKLNVEASIQALFAVKELGKPGYSQDVPKRMEALHLVAYFGIEQALQSPLDLHDWDPEDGTGRTPLSWAAEKGHEAVVRFLLAKGVNSQTRDYSSLTPFSWAAMGGHETIMRLLDTSIPGQLEGVAKAAQRKLQKFNLMWESAQMIEEGRQKDEEWQRLCQKLKDMNNRVAQIIRRRDEIDVELAKLQREKEDLNEEEERIKIEVASLSKMQADDGGKHQQLSDKWKYTQMELDQLRQIDGYEHENEKNLEPIRDVVLFRWAVEDGYAKIVELLLDRGTDATVTNEDGWLPLHTAASKGYVDIVGLLLDMDKVQVDSKDRNGQTALQVAAEKGHHDIVQLLREKGTVMSHLQQKFADYTGDVLSIVFPRDSKRVALGSLDYTVKLWDTTTDKYQQALEGYNKHMRAIGTHFFQLRSHSPKVDSTRIG
jgi:hypothetical protein